MESISGSPTGGPAASAFGIPAIDPDGKVPGALCIHSRGRIVYFSESSARWMGASSAAELVGRPIQDVVPVERVAAIRDINQQLSKTGDRTPRMKTVVKRIDGSTADCEFVVTRVEWEGHRAYQVEIYETAPQVAAEKSLEHQLAMIEAASDALITTTFNGFVTSWNPAAAELFDCPVERAIGAHIIEVASNSLDPRKIVPSGGLTTVTISRSDGSVAWIRSSVTVMHNGYVLVCVDQTAQHRAEQRFRAIIETMDGGALVIGSAGIVESVNAAAKRLFGWDPLGQRWDEVITATLPMCYDTKGKPLGSDPTEKTRTSGVPCTELIVGYDRGPSDRIWVSLSCRRLNPEDPADTAVLVFYSDVTEYQRAQDRLAHDATHDNLTGLYNRAHAVDVVAKAVVHRDCPIHAVLFIDLDNLKSINDTLGHGAGDLVLKISAQRLVNSVAADDIVARFGGDEFVCLMLSGDDVEATCQRIHTALRQPVDVVGGVLTIGASVGVRLLSDGESTDVADILADADHAMYEAKSAGRNQTRIFGRH